MANTRDVLGEQETLDRLVTDTLTELEDDGVTQLTVNALRGRKQLLNVRFPNLLNIKGYAFYDCTGLTTLDFEKVTSIDGMAFYGCRNLKHLLFRNNTMVQISNFSNTLSGTKIANGEGSIYVPSNLIETYKSDPYYNKLCVLPINAYPSTTFESIAETWQQIESNGGANLVLGDRKLVTIGENNYMAILVGKSKDTLVGGGTANTTWILLKAYESYKFNTNSSDYSDYASSELRSHITNDILPIFELKNIVKEVSKPSLLSDKTTQTINEKLWIPSLREMFGNGEESGCSYTDFFVGIYGKAKTIEWYTRSCAPTGVYIVTSSGGFSIKSPSVTCGVVLGFCL